MAYGQNKLLAGPIGEPIWLEPANPAAGAPLIVTVPAGVLYRVDTVHILYTTDATAANRAVYCAWGNAAGTEFLRALSTFLHTATLGRPYEFYGNGEPVSTIGAGTGGAITYLCAIPRLIIPATFQFRVNAINMVAGDAITGVKIRAQQWRNL